MDSKIPHDPALWSMQLVQVYMGRTEVTRAIAPTVCFGCLADLFQIGKGLPKSSE